jgi:hypothetical protein
MIRLRYGPDQHYDLPCQRSLTRPEGCTLTLIQPTPASSTASTAASLAGTSRRLSGSRRLRLAVANPDPGDPQPGSPIHRGYCRKGLGISYLRFPIQPAMSPLYRIVISHRPVPLLRKRRQRLRLFHWNSSTRNLCDSSSDSLRLLSSFHSQIERAEPKIPCNTHKSVFSSWGRMASCRPDGNRPFSRLTSTTDVHAANQAGPDQSNRTVGLITMPLTYSSWRPFAFFASLREIKRREIK